MFRILTILLLLSTVNSQLSTVHAQRLSENPTKPGWKFQGMSGKNWIQVGVYTDSAALAAAAIPRAWVGTTGADSTQGLLAYTKTDSTFWGFSGTRWHRMGQVGKPGISSISYRPGNVVDTLYYTSPNGDVNFYFNVVRDGLLAGGSVTYAGSARTYFVTAAVFRKNGLFYYTPDTTITIPALASPDSSRTDVFVLNTSSQATTITGVESANPLTPQIDPDSQVFLTTVTLRPANQSAGVDTVIIYDQNTEWTGSATGMTANFNNTSPTWRGSKSVDVGAVNNGDRLEFVNASLLNRNSYAGISMFLRLKGIVPNNNNLNVSFWNGTTQVSNMLNLPLNKGNTTGWQGISVSFSAFSWTNDLFDRVRIQFAGSGAGISGYYLDFIYLQNGISTPPPASNFLQDVRRTGDLLEKQLNGTWTTWASMSDKLNRADSAAGGYYPYSTNPKGYLQAADIAGKLNTSDTASMLNAYLRKADTSLMLNPYMRTAWFNGYFDARFATKTSDNLAEGSTNLYYTNARARAALSGGAGISYNSSTGVISSSITQYTDALARAAISLTTTGTSGAATYNSSTGVLNIPQYSGGGGGGISGTVNNGRLVFSDFGTVKDTTTLVYDRANGTVGIGQSAPSSKAILDLNGQFRAAAAGTGKVLFLPRMIDFYVPAGENGMIYYNTGNNTLSAYINGAWNSLSQNRFLRAATSPRISYYTDNLVVPTGSGNIAIHGPSFSEADNVGLDSYVGTGAKGGVGNIGIGPCTLCNITTGSTLNVGVGNYANANVTTGDYNVSMGDFANSGISTQNGNTAIGSYAFPIANSDGNFTVAANRSRIIFSDINTSKRRYKFAANLSNITAMTQGAAFEIQMSTGGWIIDSVGNTNIGSASMPTSTLQSAGSLSAAVRSITGARTLDISDYSILANATSAAFNVTLPTAVGITGRIYIIKKTDSSANAVTVNTTSSQTIDGATTYSLAAQYKYVTVQSNGTNWSIIGNN